MLKKVLCLKQLLKRIVAPIQLKCSHLDLQSDATSFRHFYFDWSEEENNLDTLKDVAAALGDRAKVLKIDIKKNEILAETLRVKGNPTFMIYKNLLKLAFQH